MKTNKLTLTDLKVESFTTDSKKRLTGGTKLIKTVYEVTPYCSVDCPTDGTECIV
ncbi:pinensin family lanthipeptide [Roseivirga sp. BDSF3-8]|uniref:pinensin family lanthipeptide n=1 Tax=Roseivirga sp. BDSF3-8 TaxID=3241598 RepID=UPI0035325192